MDLIPLFDIKEFIHKKGISRIEFIKKQREKVKNQIQRKTKRYKNTTIRGKKQLSLRKGIRFGFFTFKKRLPNDKKSKLNPEEMVLPNPSKESMIMLIV